jgi:hypothetical protein
MADVHTSDLDLILHAGLSGKGDIVLKTGPTPGTELGRLAQSGVVTGFGSGANTTVAAAPSGDTSGVTDSANLQAALNNAATGSVLLTPPGTYYLKTGLILSKQVTICSLGGNFSTTQAVGTQLVAASGATAGANNALLSVAPGALAHSFSMSGISIDLSNATGLGGFYFTNLDNSVIQGCFVRDGAFAYQLDGVQVFTLRDCFAFNQRTRGYYSSGASNVDIRFDNCVYEQTVGATWACTSAWDVAAGASLMLYGCEALRSIAGSGNWLSYGLNVTSAATTTWVFGVNSWFDAISDGTGANSANSAAINLTNTTVNVRMTNCFASASSSSGQKQRAMRINGGSDHQFTNCTFGGSGVEFATNNATRMGFVNNNFVQQFADPAVSFTGGAAPTVISWRGNTLQSPQAGIVGSAADAASFLVMTNGSSQVS